MAEGLKTYKGIDCIKLVAALLVVGIHTSWLWEYNSDLSLVMTQVLGRIAVPFFFITSGFFFARGLAKRGETQRLAYLKDYNQRLLLIYGSWSVIMLWFWVGYVKWYYHYTGTTLIIAMVRQVLFDPGVFWYILGLCVCSLISYRSILKGKWKGLLAVACLGYVFGMFGDSYYGLVKDLPVIGDIYRVWFSIFIHVRKGLTFGLLFFTIGYRLSVREEKLRLPVVPLLALLVVALGLRYAEFRVLRNLNWPVDNSVSFFVIFPAVLVFLLALRFNPGISEQASRTCRGLSACIFFCHQLILWLLQILVEKVNQLHLTASNIDVTNTQKFAVAVVVCILVYAGIRKSKVRFLNMLINA